MPLNDREPDAADPLSPAEQQRQETIAEARLKSEERFRRMVTAISDVVYRMSPDWTEMRHLVGRDFIADTADPSRTWLQQYIPLDDQPQVLAVINEAIRTKSVFELEHRVLRVDGTLGWALSRAVPLLDASGEIVEWFGTASDTTAHKRAEETLRESEAKYRTIVETAWEGIVLAAPDGAYTFVNRRMAEMLGYEPEEILGKSSIDFTFDDWRPHVLEASKQLRLGGVQGELKFRRKDGTVLWSTYNASPMFDARGVHIANLVLHADITERKRAEEQAARDLDAMTRLQKLGTLLARDGDLGPILDEIMDAAVAIAGADFGTLQLLDPTTGDLRIAAHRRLPQWWLDVWNNAGKGTDVCGTALERGERIIVENVADSPLFSGTLALDIQLRAGVHAVQSTPLVGRSGGPIGMFSTHYTRPHRPDDRVLRLLDLLARQAADIIERARAEEALREANARLAEADRRKDEFLAMLAHELRNPLSVVGGASEILQRAGDAEPEVQRARDAIQRQALHMARLVDDLLDVSRVTQGKIAIKKERVLVAHVVAHAVEAASAIIRSLGHRLFVSLPLDSLVIGGDAVRLTQIVSNLLNNAAKYSPAGGEIYLSAERRGPHVEIRVRDNGQGIDAALLPHVFDLFVQGARGADRAQGGLGIGLTMARSLVEMHGGTIEAHSDGPGTGSEFVIRLPLTPAELAPSTAADHRSGRRVSRRILVVDDNADAAEMMRTLLELDGHEVHAVRDGRAAIERAVAWRPDVALIDLGMPVMDGFEVARRLRAERSLDRTVLVALTGYGQEEDIRRSHEAGFDHHLTKSADFEPLRRLLDSIPGAREA